MDKHADSRLDVYPEKSSLEQHAHSDTVDESITVAEATHSLPGTSWVVVLACAFWNGTISCTQITCLFWSSAITASIGGSAESLWLGQSFQVVTAILGPVLARIGDSCGRRYVILLGIAFGALGSLIMATSTSINMCIAGASLFGLSYGSGGNVFSVSSEVLPRAHRGTAQVMTLFGAIFGVLLGLFVGANMITVNPGDFPGWRSACYFNFALHVVTFSLFAIFYFPRAVANPAGLSVFQRIMQIDLVGCLLLACGICPLMVGLIWGGGVYAWSSPTIIACLVVGASFFVILAGHQTKIKTDGLMSSALFENSNFLTCLLSIFVEGLIYNVFTHFYGNETGLLWDARPYFLALRFAAFIFAAALAAPLYGFWVYKTKDAKHVLLFGYASFLAGVIGMATVKLGTNQVVILYCCLCGIGFAAPLVFLNMVTQLAVKPELMGLATSLIISSRAIGGAVGIAIAGAVFMAKAKAFIPAYVAKAVAEAGLPASSVAQVVGGIVAHNTTMVKSAPGITTAITGAGSHALKVAYTDAFRYIWFVAIPFIVIGLIGLLFLKSTVHEMNAVVDRPIESSRRKEVDTEA